MRSWCPLVALLPLVSLVAPPLAADQVRLPWSGQEQCFDVAGAAIACAGSGQDGELRPGVAWPSPRFTRIYCHGTGICPTQTGDCDADGGNDLMRDGLTGLEWPRDPTRAGAANWTGALAAADAFGLCGFADFRLPNILELMSLVRYEETPYTPSATSPASWLALQGFAAPPAMSWSSTTYVFNPAIAPVADFYEGDDAGEFKSASLAVWPVRGVSDGPAQLWRTGASLCWDGDGNPRDCNPGGNGTGEDGYLRTGALWPSPRFLDNGDGTARDLLTGLVWLRDTDCLGTGGWDLALARVAAFRADPAPFACTGYLPRGRAWRLPSIVELRSLVDRSRSGPAFPAGHPFLDMPLYVSYWSSTSGTLTLSTVNARVLFNFNGVSGGNVKGSANGIWPVAGDSAGLLADPLESGFLAAWTYVWP